MFRRLILVSLGVFGAQSTLAIAGWNSGGGELFSDEVNPWFLENTKRIEYCIESDSQHFGQSIEVARAKIKIALAYWKSEFASADVPESDGQKLRLATQEAAETDCYDGIDIKFQLGTLTQEQAQYLKFPGRVIGKAVRTSYDPVTLRGKGFVYISPEKGPYALTGTGPMGGLIPNRWQYENGKLLELTFIHELGHVFGLQHNNETIMGETALGFIVSWPFGYAMVDNGTFPSVFASYLSGSEGTRAIATSGAGFGAISGEILGVPANYTYLELKPVESNKSFSLFAAPNLQAPLELIGSFTEGTSGKSSYTSMVSVYLTPVQKVFPIAVKPEGRNLDLFALTEATQTMWYQRHDQEGRRHMVFANIPAELTMTGINTKNEISLDFVNLSNWVLDWSKIPNTDPRGVVETVTKAHVKIPKFFRMPKNGKGKAISQHKGNKR